MVSFVSTETRKIWDGERIKGLTTDLQEIARRKLRMLNNSQNMMDLQAPPSNRLEKLKGNLIEYLTLKKKGNLNLKS